MTHQNKIKHSVFKIFKASWSLGLRVNAHTIHAKHEYTWTYKTNVFCPLKKRKIFFLRTDWRSDHTAVTLAHKVLKHKRFFPAVEISPGPSNNISLIKLV